MDWKLRGISGLCLYNRIRNYPKLAHTPTVVLCGFVGKEDFRLLEEMSNTAFLEKPFQLAIFEKTMRSTQVSSEIDIILAEIAGCLIEKSSNDSVELLKEILITAKKTGYQFKFLVAAASYFMHLKNYLLAEAIWEIAIKINPKSVSVMTELAKTNLRLNRPIKSLALLDQADRFAPGNIERLCLMGESGLALLDTDKARAYFLKALQIDSDQIIARAGITVANNLKDYLDINKNYKPFNLRLASTLNVVGMAYIRNEELDKGIEQYRSALCFVHDSGTLSKLQFNLGLAYLRKGDRKNAQNYIFESMGNADESFLKPGVLHSKLVSGMNFRKTVEEISYEFDEDHQAHFV
jgi:tetratricopeptide (TPR) repeat protein